MERCSGNTEEEMPAPAQSRCGTDFTVVTCQLGLEGCQADKGGGRRGAGLDLLFPG